MSVDRVDTALKFRELFAWQTRSCSWVAVARQAPKVELPHGENLQRAESGADIYTLRRARVITATL